MKCKVKATIDKYNMPIDNKTVIIAVSGGADSMALLNVMLSLKDEYNIRVIACHVNHGIRGAAADSDENFVIEQCKRLNVEIKTLKADIPNMAREKGMGLEECGRKVRYDFFKSICDNALVATAHTLSDKCETLLLNQTRGTSVKGLCSIPAVRGNIIRPLIDCTRAEIEEYCNKNNIEYITDATNFDDTYSRNRIRLNVIPELKKINPSFEKAAYRLTEAASEDEDYFSTLVNSLVDKYRIKDGYLVSDLVNQHISVRNRVISEILRREVDIEAERVHINLIDKVLYGGRTEIIGNTIVEVKNEILTVNPQKEEIPQWECSFLTPVCTIPSGKFYSSIFNRNELPLTQIVHNKVIDFDSIIGKPIIRNRRAGDKMKIAGSSCTKTLKKLFNEKHLENRDSILIIADEHGIVWVSGLGCADRCKIRENTTKILLIGEEDKND